MLVADKRGKGEEQIGVTSRGRIEKRKMKKRNKKRRKRKELKEGKKGRIKGREKWRRKEEVAKVEMEKRRGKGGGKEW